MAYFFVFGIFLLAALAASAGRMGLCAAFVTVAALSFAFDFVVRKLKGPQ